MRTLLLKALLPYTCEAKQFDQYFDFVEQVKSHPEFGGFSDSLASLVDSNDPRDSVRGSDIKITGTIYDILNFQSLATLKAKSKALVPLGPTSSLNKVPDVISPEDAIKFAREPSWTEEQACLLSIGICPNPLIEYDIGRLGRDLGFHTFTLLDDYSERLNLLRKHQYSSGFGPPTPLEFLFWFERMEYSFPLNLANSVRRISNVTSSSVEKPGANLLPLERKTLLKLIAAMAVRGYRFDSKAARNQATSDIQNDLDHCGIPLDQKTILKWLREATELIDSSEV